MQKAKFYNSAFTLMILISVSFSAYGAWLDNAQWYDEYYQYRIPVEVTVTATGIQKLSITSDSIVDAVNLLEEIKHSNKYFDYNSVKLVEYDDNGNILDVDDSSTFYVSYAGPELVINGSFENETGGVAANWNWNYTPGVFSVVSGQSHNGSKCLKIDSVEQDKDAFDRTRITQTGMPVTADTPYVFSFWMRSDVTDYGLLIYMANAASSWVRLEESLDPFFGSIYWEHRQILINESSNMTAQCNLERYHIGEVFVDDISFRQVNLDLVINPATTGAKKYMLYYQPSHSLVRRLPEHWLATPPTVTSTVDSFGSAEKYNSMVKYGVYTDANCDIWFAETTQKITPAMPVPALQKSEVTIECAKNERQSFQLVLNPKNALTIDTATISALTTGSDTIPAGSSYVKIADYVNIYTKSKQASNLIPRLADILEAFTPRALTAGGENTALWFTVILDDTVAAGTYTGTVNVTVNSTVIEIPLKLKVHKFTMPDQPSFRTAHGSNFFGSSYGGTTPYQFHGVTTADDREHLVDEYYEVMADNKTYPYGISRTAFTYDYTMPPQGCGIDAPGNYFGLSYGDFDFDDHNVSMQYWLDQKHANAQIIGHMNGDHANTFKFIDGFKVAWDHPDTVNYTPITKNQYSNLIYNYWYYVAQNLRANGWIDECYILIDETRTDWPADYDYAYGYEKMKYFMELVHMAAPDLKILHTVNYHAIYAWKEAPTDPEIAFKNLIDIWTPMISDNNYSFYEPHFFTERGMDPKEEEIWSYTVSTAHLNIDTLGLNNRCMPMKNYYFDMNGFLVWASIIYEFGTSTVNPRIDPYFTYGNGAISFFYPPGDTVTPSPDFTITPSARLEMFREGVEDFEYMVILDDAMIAAAAAGIDTSNAASLKAEMQRMFIHPERWSVNDEFYLLMRKRIMEEIDTLQWYTTYGVPTVDTADFRHENGVISIDVNASNLYRYNLLRTNELSHTTQWQVVDTALVETSDTITLTDDSYGTTPRAFYRVEAVIP